MELYKIYKSDLLTSIKVAQKVAGKTGMSTFYHLVDFLLSVVMYGVGPKQYSEGGFYKLRSFDRKKTYTRQRRNKLCNLFNDRKYLHFLRNKNEFNEYFKKFITRDWIYCKTASIEQIEEFLNRNDRVLVKPVDSTKGQGIHELEKDIKGVGNIANSMVGTDTVLEELLIQHPQMCYENKSVNTLRITTVLDRDGIAHIIKTNFRCGIGNSIVDNYSAGGVLYPVNNKYGRIEGPGNNKVLGDAILIHPDTDFFMIGRDIPYLKEALKLVQDAAVTIPQVRFVGWDVAILEKGPELIEGNTLPGEQLIEFQGLEKGFYKKIMSYL